MQVLSVGGFGGLGRNMELKVADEPLNLFAATTYTRLGITLVRVGALFAGTVLLKSRNTAPIPRWVGRDFND